MRKLFPYFLLLLILPTFGQAAELQEVSLEPTMQIMANAPSLVLLKLDTSYAIKVHKWVAVTIPASFQYSPKALSRFPVKQILGSLGVGARFFILTDAFTNGFYIEPYLAGGYGKIATYGEQLRSELRFDTNTIFVNVGAKLGYGFVYPSGFSFNVGITPYFLHYFDHESHIATLTEYGNEFPGGAITMALLGIRNGFSIGLDVMLGYSF